MAGLDGILRRVFPKPPATTPWVLYDRTRLTPRRLFNLHRVHREYMRGETKVSGRPLKLVIEATNVCNLSCPACYTGAGENGRVRSNISWELFTQVLDEQAATLMAVEFYNWGEPLLHKQITRMIAEAHARGLATIINTNLSLPFDAEKAEALIKSGLDVISVSVDGATQAGYQVYRVGGDLELVKANVRLLADARRRLGADRPKIFWSYHVFDHNLNEVDLAASQSAALGFDEFQPVKAWTDGEEWDGPGVYARQPLFPVRCPFPWQYAIVNNDGGVAPCAASFYREDDIGRLRASPDEAGAASFSELWTGEAFTRARSYFADEPRDLPPSSDICRSCPLVQNHRDFLAHKSKGGALQDFKSRFNTNAVFAYVFNRRPAGRDTRKPLRHDRPSKTTPKPEPAIASAGVTLIRNGARAQPDSKADSGA